MRIPNKFNGYSADNIRLYNDPASLALIAASAPGSMAGATLAAAGTGAAASTIPTLAGAGALGSMSGGTLAAAAPSLAPVASSAGLGILPEATGVLPQTLGGAAQAAAPVADASAKALATQTNLPTAGVNTGALTPDQVQAMGTTNQMANVKTAATPADAQAAANYYSNAQNADIASKVGSQYEASNGIMGQLKNFTDPLTSGFQKAMDYAKENPKTTAAGLYALSKMTERKPSGGEKYAGSSFRHEDFNAPMMNPLLYGANGGIMSSYADGGPVEQMSNMNAIGGNEMYPMANIPRLEYANPVQQRPVAENIMTMGGDTPTDPYTGQLKFAKGGMADFQKMLAEQEEERKEQGMRSLREHTPDVSSKGVIRRPLSEETSDPYTAAVNRLKKASQVAGIKMQEMPKLNMPESFSSVEAAKGGIMHGDLGGYSDYAAGGRLLKGPGDGVSDSIPAVIGNKQPARLADGEFVVPARIVSELGNGSTEAGARKLYAMMERIQKGRRKSVGKGKVAVNSKADKHLPA
jgi:hypothetical protein